MLDVASTDRPVLVTGGLGFVGKHLFAALSEAGLPASRIVVMSQTDSPGAPYSRVYVQDLWETAGLYEMVQNLNPIAIIHLAAIAEPQAATREQDKAWRVNFEATRALALALRTHCPDARFIFAGSSESYGSSFNQTRAPILESCALNPMNIYGATKAAADLMLGQMHRDGMDVVRFRAFNHSGPGQAPNYVVPAFAQQVARIESGKQIPILSVGNLSACRDFLDVRDVCRAYVSALFIDKEAVPKSAINISSGVARPIHAIVDELLSLSTSTIKTEIDPDRLRPSEIPYAVGDNSLLKSTFDWEQAIGFRTMIADVLESFR